MFYQRPAKIIGLFLLLTAVLYAAGYWLIYRTASATPLMLSVGLATILTCLITRTSLRELGWEWCGWRVSRLSYTIPLAYAAVAYCLIWAFGGGGWYDSAYVLELKNEYNLAAWSDTAVIGFHFTMTATVSFVLLLPSVLAEEMGWRGLLVPQLAKMMPFTGVALVSGAIWAMWHWPLMFLGLYGNESTPLAFQLICFTVCIMSMSVVMTYLRLKTDSLWPAVIMHMSHNIFLQKFFSPITAAHANSGWYLDEFGAVVPAVVLLLALLFWRKGAAAFKASAA
ncbi:MAG: type II CAAX endopeptidase family protein [Halioglobus sp.]